MEQIKFNNAYESIAPSKNKILEKLAQRIRDIFKRGPQEAEAETKEEEELSNFYEEGFDIYEKLKQVRGPFIEVAGPTEGGYRLVDVQQLGKKVYVSNRSTSWARGKLDFEASATDIPAKSESIGALFVSCLGGRQKDDPEELIKLEKKIDKLGWLSDKELEEYRKLSHESKRRLRNTALQEAFRVLEDKGVLIWQGGAKEDYEKALEMGFKIKVLKDGRAPGVAYHGMSYNFIFEKGILAPENSDIPPKINPQV